MSSAAAISQLALALPADLQPAVTAASFMDITAGFLGSRTAACAWLTKHLQRNDGAASPRNLQAIAFQLSAPDIRTALTDLEGGDAVAESWDTRRPTLERYRQTLADNPDTVLPSLLHMHHNRVGGIDPTAEASCRRMARAAALSWIHIAEGEQA